MLRKLFSHFAPPLPASAHDHLFTPFAPNGAPVSVLHDIYSRYGDAARDEPIPAQHRQFRALVDRIIRARIGGWRRLDGLDLRRVGSAYICCFERSEAFEFQLSLWRGEPAFRDALIHARACVVAQLTNQAAAERARQAHFRRWKECLAAPIDLEGDDLLSLIKRMQPDDWHEIALHWNWDLGVAELDWITSQRSCDRATAVHVLCAGGVGDIATHEAALDEAVRREGFICALAARLEGGFYPSAELGLHLPLRARAAFERQIDVARMTGVSPWQLPDGLVTHPGRTHAPKYAVTDGQAHYHYEYWLGHVAP